MRLGSKGIRPVVLEERELNGMIDFKEESVYDLIPGEDPLCFSSYACMSNHMGILTNLANRIGIVPDEVEKLRIKRFPSKAAMIEYAGRERHIKMYDVPNGFYIPRREAWYPGEQVAAYTNWYNSPKYRAATVNIPGDRSKKVLRVTDRRYMPGDVVEMDPRKYYTAEEATESALRMVSGGPETRRYDVKQIQPLKGVTPDVARKYGFDGRDLGIGESMEAGNHRITRVRGPYDGNATKKSSTSTATGKSTKKTASSQRKPSKASGTKSRASTARASPSKKGGARSTTGGRR